MANPLIVQKATGSNGSGNASATLSAAPTAGNGILVAAVGNVDPTSVKDNAGTPNSYTKVRAGSGVTSPAVIVSWWYFANLPSGLPSSYQVSIAGCSYSALAVFEISGLVTAGLIDVGTDAGHTGTSSTPSGNNLTTASVDLLAFVGADQIGSNTDTWTLSGTSTAAGWTDEADTNDNAGGQDMHVAMLPAPTGSNAGQAAGTIAGPSWTMAAGSGGWTVQGVAVKVAGGGATGKAPPPFQRAYRFVRRRRAV